eukprot:NODE_207_length_14754_cov_0.677994.p6 type:complete len:118 gc:universal NODE_207_length_14754_cov_0.677994:11474-11827(+)
MIVYILISLSCFDSKVSAGELNNASMSEHMVAIETVVAYLTGTADCSLTSPWPSVSVLKNLTSSFNLHRFISRSCILIFDSLICISSAVIDDFIIFVSLKCCIMSADSQYFNATSES